MLFNKTNKQPGELEIHNLASFFNDDKQLTIFEIGCNDGTHTKKFIDIFPDATIYAFEPDPRAIQRFLDNTKDVPQIKLFKKAISSDNGYTTFHMSNGAPTDEWKDKLPEGWDMSGSIKKPKKHLKLHSWCTFDETIEVETQTLDSFCDQQNVKNIDFIWADVQGAEEDLIRGGLESLKNTRYFYTEYNDNELYEGQISLKKILKLLPMFKIHTLYENDVLLINELY